MQRTKRPPFRLLTTILAALVAFSGYGLFSAASANAEANPTGLSSTIVPRGEVTADALPTVQIDGVVWAIKVVGDVVYAGGQFTSARPAGAAPGVDETPRNNFLAFNRSTGELIPTIGPSFNAKVTDIDSSADGSTIYVAGSFTQVDGQNRYRLVALDAATGAVKAGFAPGFDATINAIDVAGNVLYAGGAFSKVGSQTRQALAAVDATTGATLSWAPSTDYQVQGVAVTPDASRVVLSGNFTQINGVINRGLGAVTSDTGTELPFPVNTVLVNYGDKSSHFDLSMYPDGTVYGSAFAWSQPHPNFTEGGYSINAYTGELIWTADCHGDTYDIVRMRETVYMASHHHHCSNIGAFPDTNPRTRYFYADSVTAAATGKVLTNDQGGYFNFEGQPAPSMKQWFPRMEMGTFTGQSQSVWRLDADDEYLIMGGEFPRINGVSQQGLARFTLAESAPKKIGPNEAPAAPKGFAQSASALRLLWTTVWDRDDLTLSYDVFREGVVDPVCTVTAASTVWETPTASCIDNNTELGTTYRYRVRASDPDGNRAWGPWGQITTPETVSPYQAAVLGDVPRHYWQMGTTGSIADLVGGNQLSTSGRVSIDNSGAISGDPAVTFGDWLGSGTAGTATAQQAPNTFTIEAWFKTTTTSGGKIVGFGNRQLTNSSSYDRHIYLTNDGRVIFGVYPGGVRTIESPKGFNDGQWHHVAASLSSSGMALYIDGLRMASRADTTTGQPFSGYWRVGNDSLSGWPSAPFNTGLRGSVDDIAIYPTALSQQQIAAHIRASGRTVNVPTVPSDDYGAEVYNADPLLFWRLDETTGTTAKDAFIGGYHGNYAGSPQLGTSAIVQGHAVGFDGVNDTVVSTDSLTIPGSFSHELWFSSTSTTGGRLIGFGNSATGNSTRFDRAVSLNQQGQLSFTAGETELITAASYNDGQPHHVVATQGPLGMTLYVDGVQMASNDSTPPASFIGYLRVGGDGQYFTGTIDEVALYSKVLSAEQVRENYRVSGLAMNHPPSADLAVSCDAAGLCTFTATATDPDGAVVGYSWDLGDGNTAEGPEVTHSYAAGTYQVVLTVTDDEGATGTATTEVVVRINEPPVAVFTVDCNYLECSFDASGSTDDDTIASYAWEFGDGTVGEGITSSHAFESGGSYDVVLTVVDNDGASTSASQQVTVVANQAPVPVIAVTCTDLSCNFDASGSYDPDGTIASVEWALGDQTSSTELALSHSYAAAGSYVATLTVTDNMGLSATATTDVEVQAPNQLPVASFTHNAVGLQLSVDASASSDPDGDLLSYSWDFGDGSPAATTASLVHEYAEPGSYLVTLTVTDDRGGAASTTAEVTIEDQGNQPPAASFTVDVQDLLVNVDASASSDPDGTITSYDWDFGDGTTATGVTASHSYAAAGSYQLRLQVTDDQGAIGTTTSEVTVAEAANQAPTAVFTHTVADLELTVDGSGSSDPDGTISSHEWSFGDGATATGPSAQHSYAAAGDYEVSLTVTDDRGAQTSVSETITVTAPPPDPGEAVVVAQDSFTRTGPNWGSAEIGGTWTYTTGASRFSTDGSQGVITLLSRGQTTQAKLADVAARDVQFDMGYTLDAMPTGNGVQQTLILRQVDSGTDYRMTVWIASDGLARVNLTAMVNGASRSLGDRIVPGVNYQPGQTLRMSFVAVGEQTTELSGYVWLDGQERPSTPAIGATDSTPELQNSGAISVRNYVTGSTSVVPVVVKVDDLLVTDLSGQLPPPAPNQLPVAAFTAAINGFDVSVDASASSDPDGTISSYAWDFGDGSTASGVSAQHHYASPGSYQITLTVTDNLGDTATASREVTADVVTEPGVLIAQDGFGRTGNGWGSADLGGAWTATAGGSMLSTDGNRGVVNMGNIRDTATVRLGGVSVQDVRVSASFALDAQPTGNGVHQTLIARQLNGGTDYRFTVWIAADNQLRVNLTTREGWTGRSHGDLIVSGINWTPGDVINMAFEVTGSGTTTLSGYVWKQGEPMPTSPAITATDSTAVLQSAGMVGVANYLTGSATVTPVVTRWDDFSVRELA